MDDDVAPVKFEKYWWSTKPSGASTPNGHAEIRAPVSPRRLCSVRATRPQREERQAREEERRRAEEPDQARRPLVGRVVPGREDREEVAVRRERPREHQRGGDEPGGQAAHGQRLYLTVFDVERSARWFAGTNTTW